MNELIKKLKDQFGIFDILSTKTHQTFFTVDKIKLVSLITNLKEIEDFSVLILISAVDWIEDGKFQLTYLLNHPDHKQDFGIRVFINREDASMDSIHRLWKHAATFQREMKEMFGIDFPGSPRVDEPFLLEGWDDIPPMRREFDTKKYSEETYFPRPGRKTNDPAEYMKQKMYPDEK